MQDPVSPTKVFPLNRDFYVTLQNKSKIIKSIKDIPKYENLLAVDPNRQDSLACRVLCREVRSIVDGTMSRVEYTSCPKAIKKFLKRVNASKSRRVAVKPK